MKLLFVVTGIGLGDATREHANIEALLRKDPNTEILVAGYDNSYEYFKAKYQTIKIKGYNMQGRHLRFNVLSFVINNIALPFIWLGQAVSLRMLVKRFNPDIIISDFEPTGIAIARFTKKKCVMIFGYDPLAFEEFAKHHKVSKIMILEHEYLKKVYSKADFAIVQTLIRRRQSVLYHYVNPIIRFGPDDLPQKNVLMKRLGLKKAPILVTLGGSEFGMKLARIIDSAASKLKNESFIILGASKMIPKSKNVIHYPFKENALEYLKVSKGVISLAGQKSLTEALVFKKPILAFPIQNHIEQALNAFAIEDKAMVCWGCTDKKMGKMILDFIQKIPTMQKRMNAFHLKHDGAEEVARIVYGISQQEAIPRG